MQTVATLSADDYADVGAVSDELARAIEARFPTVRTMIEAPQYPIWRVCADVPALIDQIKTYAKGWLMARPAMTTRLIPDEYGPMYVADGPDGHTWLLKRTTEAAALRDGLAYFLATRVLDGNGKWVLRSSEELATRVLDGNGKWVEP